MYVRSHDRFIRYGLFDPDSGSLETRTRAPSREPDQVVEGHFASLAGEMVIFYRKDAYLYVGCGGNRWPADEATIRWEPERGHSRFAVVEGDREVFALTYSMDFPGPELVTSFSEPEDWDFGLFIYNVVNDPARAARIYRQELG
jgi:hypothetical protein